MEVTKPDKSKEEYILTRKIEVENQPSELKVKLVLDVQKATFKVSTAITTKQTSDIDKERNGATIEELADMVLQAIDKGLERRRDLLAIQDGTVGTSRIPFPDNLDAIDAEEPGERSPTGNK